MTEPQARAGKSDRVSLADASAKVTYDAALTGLPELKRAVGRAGFDVP